MMNAFARDSILLALVTRDDEAMFAGYLELVRHIGSQSFTLMLM